MEAILSTQPESNWELFKRATRLYKLTLTKTFLFSFILALVVFIPRMISTYLGRNIFATLTPFSASYFWIVVLNLVILGLFIAIIWHMHCVIRHKHEPIREDMLVGVKKVLTVFLAGIIENTIIFAVALCIIYMQTHLQQYNWLNSGNLFALVFTICLFLAQFLLIAYVATLFYFLAPIITTENAGLFSAIKRSASLVWNHWWRTISLQLAPWLCYLLVLLLLKFVVDLDIHIYFLTPHNSYDYSSLIINLFLFAFFIPLVAATLLVQLKDLELRKKLALK